MNGEVKDVQNLNNEEKNWAMACHLATLIGIIIPFGNVIAPLVIWLMKKDQMPMVDREGKKSLNFQILMTICMVVAFLLMFVLIGFILLPIIGILAIVFAIIAAVKVSNGVDYQYPVNVKFIS